MSHIHHRRFTAILLFVLWSVSALADPPARVARLGYASGAVSFSAAGENDWVQARLNRPLASGDRLWSDADGRAEVQAGGAMVRMDAETSLTLLNLDDRIAQLQLTQGTLHVNVRYLGRDQVVEVNTPQLAFTLRQPGSYRISVDPSGDATDIVVRNGQGEAYGVGTAYVLDTRQPYRFRGTGLRDYQALAKPAPDAFERWASARDRRLANSASARYVSRDVVGYQDLDANGRWRNDRTYGNVWVPDRMPAGWAPYRDGHWSWIDPWGWTWVDDAPWGYAVSHYGRWANMDGTWGWVPGPVRAPAVYAPAQVAFVGGDNLRLNVASAMVGAVAWFALAPREVYYPPYQASRDYTDRINRSNTVINNTTVINNSTVVNNTTNVTNINTVVYANRSIPGAVVAVPTTTFVQSQPVARAVVLVSHEQLANRPASERAAVAPTERSVHSGASAAGKPPAQVLERVVVARTAPPATYAGIAAQLAQLAQQPGKPLDDAARKALKPTAAAAAPIVKVFTVPLVTPPVAAPPPLTRPAASAPVAGVAPPASAPVARPVPLPARLDPARGPGQAATPEIPARPALAPALPAAPPAAAASTSTAAPAKAAAAAPAPAAIRVPASAPVAAPVPVPPPVAQRPVEPKLPAPPVVIPTAPAIAPPASAPPKKDPPANQKATPQPPLAGASAGASAAGPGKPGARPARARPGDPKDEDERLREEEKRKQKG